MPTVVLSCSDCRKDVHFKVTEAIVYTNSESGESWLTHPCRALGGLCTQACNEAKVVKLRQEPEVTFVDVDPSIDALRYLGQITTEELRQSVPDDISSLE